METINNEITEQLNDIEQSELLSEVIAAAKAQAIANMPIIVPITEITINNIGEIPFKSNVDLEISVAEHIKSFDEDKMVRIRALQVADIGANEMLVQISRIASEVAPSPNGLMSTMRTFKLFNGELYEVKDMPKAINLKTSANPQIKAAAGANFNNDDKVQFMDVPTIFTVFTDGSRKKVMDENGIVINPSDIVCNYYDKPTGTMPGLSAKGWKKIN